MGFFVFLLVGKKKKKKHPFCWGWGRRLRAEAQELRWVRALKQELSQATPGSWSSWPGVSPSLIFATIFVPSPPFWEVPASSAPMSPGPQWRADPKSPATPLLGRPTGVPSGVWLSRPAEEGGRRRRDASAALPRPQEGSGLVPALLHSRPAPPRNLVAAQPPSHSASREGLEGSAHSPHPRARVGADSS